MKMLVNRAAGLVREPITRGPRKGKTARDHANGNKQRSWERKMARAAWQQDSRATNETFPG